MIRYHYRDEWGSLGKIARPVANVILENDGLQVGTSMYVDSGADLTMIPLRFGRAIGLKQEPSDVIHEVRGISGTGIPQIVKKIVLILNGERLKARICWALVEEVPLLLGRVDVFKHFEVIFNERKGWVDFKKHRARRIRRS